MQLTLYTDYSLRVLIYLGAHRDETVTISEIAESYGISRNHLVKVVHNLAGLGFIHTTRGKGGGMRLMRPPEEINLGEVVRSTEGGFDLVECMNGETNTCPIHQMCQLKGVVREALNAFTAVWDRYTLADILQNRNQLVRVLRLHPGALRSSS
jgi:Rrf2 family nitric oxide-sensitive transcriptional repressor